jgi:DNA-binding response OmpR family regulator
MREGVILAGIDKASLEFGKLGGGKEMVKTAIYRLRQKIEKDPHHPDYILTMRGTGYIMSSEE